MSKNTPVRKVQNSTADLLTWPENTAADSPASVRSSARSHQPSDGISKVVFGGQVTDEEVESLNKRKPVSGYKLKEITGSGIFAAGGENDVEESDAANPTPSSKTGLRMYQQTVSGISHISFGEEESVSPKKALSEAKQRELSGTLDNESDAKLKKQFSNAKNKELSGNDIFAPPPEIKPRPLGARALALRESISIGESPHTNGEEPVKTAKKIPSQKFTELSGNNIFKGDEPPPSSEKSLSSAKLREMSGSNIFADGKAESRDYLGGVRKPPGGESSIALHTGILHIGLGCWALLTFGPQVCRAYGPFTFFLIYVLGGLSGNLTSFLHTPDPTVGGTGPVFAIIGAWLIYQYQNKDATGKDVFESMYKKAIVATALGFVLSELGPIDDWMHFGSAFTGIAYGLVTCPTLQIDDSSSETGKENGITLIRRNVDPRKSLVWFSIFVVVLSSLLLMFEPPLGSLVLDSLV